MTTTRIHVRDAKPGMVRVQGIQRYPIARVEINVHGVNIFYAHGGPTSHAFSAADNCTHIDVEAPVAQTVCERFGHAWIVKRAQGHLEMVCSQCKVVAD